MVPTRTAVTALVAIATIVLALVATVLVPVDYDRRADPVRALLHDGAEPARAEITALYLALATAEAHLHDVLASRNRSSSAAPRPATPATVPTGDPDAPPATARAYQAEAERVAASVERLAVVATRWRDAGVAPRVDAVRQAVAVWRESGEAVIAGGRAGARTRSARALGHGERYADAALAAARLDEAIAVGARRLQMRLDWLETDSRRWTYGLAALALAGVAAALWLGLAVRAAAVEAEAGRRALAAALESKARFTRGLSHDLKNPLGAIDGHAALLEAEIHGPLNAAQRGAIARVRGAVRALLALVDDLLALAHAETGELAVRPVATDVHALVRDLVEEHRASVNGAGLTLETCVPAQARECATDAARLRQVLGNLLANATKYTPSGGRVTVEVCDGTDCVRVEVRDTGPGIPPDRREFVFQEFTRLPGTAAPGAGLGLAISRHIARLLGGDLWVDERPEPGACFVLEVPASVRTGARPPPGARAAQPADGRGAGRVGGVAS